MCAKICGIKIFEVCSTAASVSLSHIISICFCLSFLSFSVCLLTRSICCFLYRLPKYEEIDDRENKIDTVEAIVLQHISHFCVCVHLQHFNSVNRVERQN